MSSDIEKIIPATAARKNFFSILKDIQKPGAHYTITLEGRPLAVFMSSSEFNSWKETIEISSDKSLAEDLLKMKNDFALNNFIPLEDVLREQGFLVAETPEKKYVPRSFKKKSKKRTK